MTCNHCGEEIEDDSVKCIHCGADTENVYKWSELIPLPVFYKNGKEIDEDDETSGRLFSRRTKRIILQIVAVFAEIALLAGVISGIYVWKYRNMPTPPIEAENIVYSSDDIVMMLVSNKEQWIVEKPDEGYNSCCFLDMDFDGSPELISIAYDSESKVTNLRAFNVRNCTLDEILPAQQEAEGFFDIGQNMELYYAPETKEMLYLSVDNRISDKETSELTGSFYMFEKQIYQRMYFCENNTDGICTYYHYNDSGVKLPQSRQEYRLQQRVFNRSLVDLKLSYEWVQNRGDISELSEGKLAALLLRSYDSFSYDTSGLALN